MDHGMSCIDRDKFYNLNQISSIQLCTRDRQSDLNTLRINLYISCRYLLSHTVHQGRFHSRFHWSTDVKSFNREYGCIFEMKNRQNIHQDRSSKLWVLGVKKWQNIKTCTYFQPACIQESTYCSSKMHLNIIGILCHSFSIDLTDLRK